MGRYLLHRVGITILVAFTVSVIAFSLLRLSGDLAAELAGDDATEQQIAEIAHAYGLDRPFHVQYVEWVANSLSGDFGISLFTKEPVADIVATALPVTATLATTSLLLSLLISIPLGVLAATRPNSWVDRTALGIAVFGQAVPHFWFALVLILVFGVYLQLLPIAGQEDWVHFVLPTLTIALSSLPPKMRLVRSGMLEVLESDYIRTARAKGLSPQVVLYKHALRNAILPVVSLTMVNFGQLLGGTVVVETVFGINGLGYKTFQAIVRLDFPVVQTIVVLISFIYIGLTLVADLVNARLDPRIRLG